MEARDRKQVHFLVLKQGLALNLKLTDWLKGPGILPALGLCPHTQLHFSFLTWALEIQTLALKHLPNEPSPEPML